MTEQRQVSGTEAKAIAEAEAIEASIQPGQYPVMGISSIRAWQLVNYFKAYGSTYPAEVLTQGGAPVLRHLHRCIMKKPRQKASVRRLHLHRR